MKGIILAGGTGSRLFPLTFGVSKQLLPIYSKPLIYYPLATLMLCGLRDILLICTPRDEQVFRFVLGDGSQWGINLHYTVQHKPKGLPDAYILGETFLNGESSVMMLGDNVLFGQQLKGIFHDSLKMNHGAHLFCYPVLDPERFGVVEIDESGKVLSIQEKPQKPKSSMASVGLYICDGSAPDIAKSLKPSDRGEIEIVDLHNQYLHEGKLSATVLSRGTAWFDAGSQKSLLEACNFVSAVENRQGLVVLSPDEIAWRNGWISSDKLEANISQFSKSDYGIMLSRLLT
jgi:glucose-1-phosphate thymidylyltransferase